jgi:hypothetical protein
LPKIDTILLLTDVIQWEFHIQLFSDLIISSNGIPGTIRNNDEAQNVEVHVGCKDLVYKDAFNIPRIGAGRVL